MTHGFAVLAAARAAQAGASLEEAAALARAVAARGQMIGVLDTMRYLARSGRVPWIVHGAAALLRIRPVIAFESGKPRSFARVRSSARGDEELLRYLRGKAGPAEGMHVAVMHADAPSRAAAVASRIRSSVGPGELLVTEVTPVMGVHTGPGFVGIAFYSDEGLPRPKAARSKWEWLLERDVRVLQEALGEIPGGGEQPPVAVVLSGLPGAGKSHLARALAGRHPFVQLDSDRLRRALFKSPKYSQGENFRLFSAYHELMGRLLGRGVPVICDATNLKEAHRRQLYEIAAKHGARLVIVKVQAPRRVVERRLDRRLREPGPWDESEAGHDVYQRMHEEEEPIQRPHIVADTSGDIGAEVQRILCEAGLGVV
jgi:predicted kinase